MSMSQTPGLLTDEHQSVERLAAFKGAGYEWIAYQAQNGGSIYDYDLTVARSAGLTPAVWGVTYDQARFYQDGFSLGRQAVRLGAAGEVIMDAEFCAKGTRASRGMRPIIKGIRDGGWSGPVTLNTMGPPYNPEVNDYEIDVESFLETGGFIQTQAYANETDAFLPRLAKLYWTRVGVPVDRINYMISFYPAESDKDAPGRYYDGNMWLQLLRDAGVGRNFSIFMAEAVKPSDLAALAELSLPPQPEPRVDVNENYNVALARLSSSVNEWRRRGKDEAYVASRRQAVALRVLLALQDPEKMTVLNDALDDVGAPDA